MAKINQFFFKRWFPWKRWKSRWYLKTNNLLNWTKCLRNECSVDMKGFNYNETIICFKKIQKWSGMFIPDPFFPSRIQRPRKHWVLIRNIGLHPSPTLHHSVSKLIPVQIIMLKRRFIGRPVAPWFYPIIEISSVDSLMVQNQVLLP